MQAAPKVYEEGPGLENLRAMVHTFAEQYNADFQANRVGFFACRDAEMQLDEICVERVPRFSAQLYPSCISRPPLIPYL